MNQIVTPKVDVIIMAGNPRVEKNKGTYRVDTQAIALEAGLRIAAAINETGQKVRIVTLLDHINDISVFCEKPSPPVNKEGLRALSLGTLSSKIQRKFAPITSKYGVSMSDIGVLSEQDLKKAAYEEGGDGRKKSGLIPEFYGPLLKKYVAIKNQMCLAKGFVQEEDKVSDGVYQANCKGILATALWFLGQQAPRIITCWEYHPKRANPTIVQAGTQSAHAVLGLKASVEEYFFLTGPGGKPYEKYVIYEPE